MGPTYRGRTRFEKHRHQKTSLPPTTQTEEGGSKKAVKTAFLRNNKRTSPVGKSEAWGKKGKGERALDRRNRGGEQRRKLSHGWIKKKEVRYNGTINRAFEDRQNKGSEKGDGDQKKENFLGSKGTSDKRKERKKKILENKRRGVSK